MNSLLRAVKSVFSDMRSCFTFICASGEEILDIFEENKMLRAKLESANIELERTRKIFRDIINSMHAEEGAYHESNNH